VCADIYYLEVCVLNEVCANRHEMFQVGRGTPFRCRIDMEGYRKMQEAVMQWG
jgi:hypothetical protein